MTPSQLLKINIKHYKFVIITMLLFFIISLYFTTSKNLKASSKYEVKINMNLETKLLIDQTNSEIGTYNPDNYIIFLRNYIIANFVNSNLNKNGELIFDHNKNYLIGLSYNNTRELEKFENNLSIFLEETQEKLNEEIINNYKKSEYGRNKFDEKKDASNIQVFFTKDIISKKQNNKILLYFLSLIMGIIISNFILILEYPVKKNS